MLSPRTKFLRIKDHSSHIRATLMTTSIWGFHACWLPTVGWIGLIYQASPCRQAPSLLFLHFGHVSYSEGLLCHACYPTCLKSFLLYITDSSLSPTLNSLCKVLYAASYIRKKIALSCISKQPGGVIFFFPVQCQKQIFPNLQTFWNTWLTFLSYQAFKLLHTVVFYSFIHRVPFFQSWSFFQKLFRWCYN